MIPLDLAGVQNGDLVLFEIANAGYQQQGGDEQHEVNGATGDEDKGRTEPVCKDACQAVAQR